MPVERLSKFLASKFKELTKFEPKYGIRNRGELISALKDISVPQNVKLVSYDVTSLFPSVPPAECKVLVKRKLQETVEDPTIQDEMMTLLGVCIDYNYFCFNGSYYRTQDGLAIGLSPLLAELFMDNLEQEFIFKTGASPLVKNVLFYKRYVDDSLALWRGSVRELDRFQSFMNSVHPSIKFTTEVEESGSINFLDLTIYKENGGLRFKVYRKATHTDMVIHRTSNHPWQHKTAAFRSMVWRALTVPMEQEAFDSEINIIKQVAVNNGYEETMVDTLVKVTRRKLDRAGVSKMQTKEPKKFRRMAYTGGTSEALMNDLKKAGIEPAPYTIGKLGRSLTNHKLTPRHDAMSSGVYRLQCSSPGCNGEYIGRTSRAAAERWKEHEDTKRRIDNVSATIQQITTDLEEIDRLMADDMLAHQRPLLGRKRGELKKVLEKKRRTLSSYQHQSAFAKHLVQEEHEFRSAEGARLIHREERFFRLVELEALEIFLSEENPQVTTLNDKSERVSPLYKRFLEWKNKNDFSESAVT
ncbi:Hypothetical protein NTJ_00134 [Nesidiocoris tenuis]|uniref:Helix-turn-helix domain-containing protein n=1 Tax=Nesidiocoris tenuis TaxID=355587 RepID=A0ABN7A882_9HEMI|nr:Hypothetical protein NTJ_00134 [Nesidiocoris tenuis]